MVHRERLLSILSENTMERSKVRQLHPPLTWYNKDEVNNEFLPGLEVSRRGRTVRRERLPLSSESAVTETVRPRR